MQEPLSRRSRAHYRHVHAWRGWIDDSTQNGKTHRSPESRLYALTWEVTIGTCQFERRVGLVHLYSLRRQLNLSRQ